MTIKWDAEHPDSNTCAEQWHYNVDFRLNNDRCSSDDFLNRDDGSIDMIVYKVEGPRSNLGGISSISSMGNPKDFEWLRNRTKPTARQISISKSLTESMVKQNLCWTGHFIPPPPTENASIKWPVQVKPLKKHMFTWNGHFIPQPVGSRTLTRKRKDWQQGKGGKLQRRGTTGRLPQENETCHVYIRLLFSMCHIDWRWLVYWICCRCILEHMYTYDSHININIYKS